jgi:hypothetical protein
MNGRVMFSEWIPRHPLLTGGFFSFLGAVKHLRMVLYFLSEEKGIAVGNHSG